MFKINPLVPIEHRLFLLEDLPKNSICAEIGVFEGTFSYKIIEICKPKKIYLIDNNFQPNFHINKKYFKCEYIEIQNKFENIKLQDNYFDWVYLDTDHLINSTLNQLNKCFKKVKKDGFICGDDYTNEYRSLMIAVDIFLKKYKNKLELEYIKNGQYKIWKKK